MPKLDDVLPDTRDTYSRSRSLPDLEVPPDLTLEEGDEMEIPGEEPATLTEFQRMKRQQRGASSALQTLEDQFPGEQALAVKGSAEKVWPKLEQFFTDKGYVPELSDYELGVLETGWKQEDKLRERYKIFAEPDETGLNTVLLLSSERQENVGLDESSAEWLTQESNTKKDRKMMQTLRKEFYKDSAPVTATATADAEQKGELERAASAEALANLKAEIVDAGDNKQFLTIPEEYTRAWRRTEQLILQSGLFIEDQDQEKGLYYILFTEQQDEDEEGFFSKLKFWGDDEPDGRSYQISLTGVGNKTELVVLNENGDWDTGADATEILAMLQKRYNEG
ncbi:MAG: outer membrane protein assembly factor BamC [Thiotrichales bacterium]|nr:outer membrane protein assembly factor BamC [Thiotrichales bacterium]